MTVVPPEDQSPEGHASFDIGANQEEMLRYALEDKAPKMSPLIGFDVKALVLINHYVFGDEVESITEDLRESNRLNSVFDCVFYVSDGRLALVYDAASSA